MVTQDAHEPTQEPLHEPKGAIDVLITGQNRRRLRVLTRSLGQWWTCFGQLFLQGGILSGKPIDLSLERTVLVRDQPALKAVLSPLALADRA